MLVGGLSQSVNQSRSRPKGDFSIFRGAMAPLAPLDPPLLAPPAGSGAWPQPKSNLVHFSLKMWHLVAKILIIFLRINGPNFVHFMIRIRFATLVHINVTVWQTWKIHRRTKQIESEGALISAPENLEQRREMGLWKRDDLHCLMDKSNAVS